MIEYEAGSELPDWEQFVQVNGDWLDLSTGYTFVVTVTALGAGSPTITKTIGIIGAAGTAPNAANPVPSSTVAWATTEIRTLALGTYEVEWTATRTADGKKLRKTEQLRIV